MSTFASNATSSSSGNNHETAVGDGDNPFTSFYGQLLHQGNMLADYTRTGTYQRAMFNNSADFTGKVVLDVGTGTGILSFFALQAGAAMVYAVDASQSVKIAEALAKANGYGDRMKVIQGKIESVQLPQQVDIIISEPIGFLLVHERMLESYVVARDRFLKTGGLMMPSTGSIVLTPFCDYALHKEQEDRALWWQNQDFYGVDLTPAVEQAYTEYFSQPIVGYVSPEVIISSHRTIHTVDFSTVTVQELQNFDVSFSFVADKTALMHGFAGWFDISFLGSSENIILSTAPDCPGTHWYQCRLLLRHPIAVNKGQSISGNMHFQANDEFSYYIDIVAKLDGTDIVSHNRINLKDQQYNYLTQAPAATTAAT